MLVYDLGSDEMCYNFPINSTSRGSNSMELFGNVQRKILLQFLYKYYLTTEDIGEEKPKQILQNIECLSARRT